MSKTVKSKIPPLVHIGNPQMKNMQQQPMTIQALYLAKEGFSSRMKAKKVWTPPQIEDNARLEKNEMFQDEINEIYGNPSLT